jgi:type III secretion protein X
MRRVRNATFSLDQGIEKIFHAEDEKVDGGTVGDISPAFSPIKPRLEQLYALPNIEDYLMAQLAPLINEPALLKPTRFNNALRASLESLEAAAEEDPRNARILRRAARLMGDQVTLRDLVQMYRYALLKG